MPRENKVRNVVLVAATSEEVKRVIKGNGLSAHIEGRESGIVGVSSDHHNGSDVKEIVSAFKEAGFYAKTVQISGGRDQLRKEAKSFSEQGTHVLTNADRGEIDALAKEKRIALIVVRTENGISAIKPNGTSSAREIHDALGSTDKHARVVAPNGSAELISSMKKLAEKCPVKTGMRK